MGRWILVGCGVISLLLVATVIALATPHLDDGIGDSTYHPRTFVEDAHAYSFGIGTLDVDLRDVNFPPGVHLVSVDLGIGSARVWLPADVDYDVTGEV